MAKVETVKFRKGGAAHAPYYKIPLPQMALGLHKHINEATGEVLEDIEIKEV